MRTSGLILATLVSFSLFAAGHEVSSIRYAPIDYFGSASVAYNGKHFLALWPAYFNIYSSVFDPSGGTLSPAFPALPVASGAVQLTAAGNVYLAIWNNVEGPPSLGTFNSEGVLERRVLLTSDPFFRAQLAFNGTNALIVDRQGAVVVTVYDLTGRLIKRYELPVEENDSYAVTAAGSDFIVVTNGKSGINEWRLAADGTVLSTLRIALPVEPEFYDEHYAIAVAAKNGRIAIAWDSNRPAHASVAVIQHDGSVTRSELPDGDMPPGGGGLGGGITILPTDGGFFAAWSVYYPRNAIFAVRLDGNGVPLEARPVDLGNAVLSSAASTGKTIALARSMFGFAATPLLIVDVDADGIRPRTLLPIPVAPVLQRQPSVAGNGAGFTTTWVDSSLDSQKAAAGRVTAMGEPLDGPGSPLAENLGQRATSPVIARGSSGALIVWGTNGQLVAARVTPFGTTLDPIPIVIAPLAIPDYAAYSVAWNGSRFFVVWADGPRLFGSFVGLDGTATPARPLAIPLQRDNVPDEPDVAWDGRQFLVVYGDGIVASGGRCNVKDCFHYATSVHLVRVSAEGIAIDRNPVTIPGFHWRAHIASSGSESLIALDGEMDITAMIVLDDGSLFHLGPEFPILRWIVNSIFASDVAWTGAMYVVASRSVLMGWQTGWIRVSSISQSGVPLGSFFTHADGLTEFQTELLIPSVAANDAGDAAVVVSEKAAPTYVPRARLYLMSEMAPTPPPPAPPRNAVAFASGKISTAITWESDASQDGFVVETSPDSGRFWFAVGRTAADGRSTLIFGYTAPYLFRVRAVGSGGLSEPALASTGRVERRRPARK